MAIESEVPMTVNDLINKLKLLPPEWRIEVENSDGKFYVKDLEITEDCEVGLILMDIP